MSEEPGHAVFRGTAAQWRLYGCIHRQVAPAPLEATLAAARVSLSSYYRWLKQPGFAAWITSAWMEQHNPVQPGDLLALRLLPALADHPRGIRPALGLVFSPYGLANLHPPPAAPAPRSRAARTPSPLPRLYRFNRLFSGRGFAANFGRIRRTGLFRPAPSMFQSVTRKKDQ